MDRWICFPLNLNIGPSGSGLSTSNNAFKLQAVVFPSPTMWGSFKWQCQWWNVGLQETCTTLVRWLLLAQCHEGNGLCHKSTQRGRKKLLGHQSNKAKLESAAGSSLFNCCSLCDIHRQGHYCTFSWRLTGLADVLFSYTEQGANILYGLSIDQSMSKFLFNNAVQQSWGFFNAWIFFYSLIEF